MNQTALYIGSFDPITLGHIDLINRASLLFAKLVIVVADNQEKSSLFTAQQRLDFVEKTTAHLNNVKALCCPQQLTVAIAKKHNAKVLIRGIRNCHDLEFEQQLCSFNRKLATDIETLFLFPAEEYRFISSSLIKDLARLNQDTSAFVPKVVAKALQQKFK